MRFRCIFRTNALNTPIGLDTPKPTFSWMSDATTPNWTQSAYEILVDPEVENLRPGHAASWDSGRIASSESLDIAYAGAPLKPQQRYAWKVITWDSEGKAAASETTWFETGLMNSSDWKAQWIRRKDPQAEKELSAIRWVWLQGADAMHVASATPAHFRYEFQLEGTPLAGSLHVLARGAFIARVNGQVTGHHDEWGAFDREEISSLLHSGQNEIEIDVVSHRTDHPSAPSPAALAAAIHITRADGTEERLVTDDKWQARSTGQDAWEAVQTVGPLSAAFGIGTDRQQPIPGPDRIVTDASLLRKDFTVESSIQTARLTITALGAYHAYINNQPVAPNTLLAPGWTDFHKRVQYQTYDVTPLLNDGANTIGVVLGGGWYSSPMTWVGFRSYPGPNLLRAQLELTFANGQHQTIVTDPSWLTAPAPITFSEIYGGESYDARLARPGWNSPHFNAADWTPAVVAVPPDAGITISAQPDLPINTVMTIHPIDFDAANAAHPAIFDMGQNMVGNVRIHVRGQRGTVVRLRYAERLNPDGSIYTENLRNADATDTYTLSGEGDETWTPEFTFHGFRYVELSLSRCRAGCSTNSRHYRGPGLQ